VPKGAKKLKFSQILTPKLLKTWTRKFGKGQLGPKASVFPIFDPSGPENKDTLSKLA
jgi:hypothetical protein